MVRILRFCNTLPVRFYTKAPGAAKPTGVSSSTPASNVTGLTSSCVKPVSGPVGPGAAPDSQYKVPEYFCFNRFSFAEAEVEMAKYRCPQPSALKK